MTEVPRDVTDLWLAPVALELDARIQELALLPAEELAFRVALDSDYPDRTREQRVVGLLRTVGYLIDTRGWELSLDRRGIRLHHDRRSLVLGIPESFRNYVGAAEPAEAELSPAR